MPTGAVQCSDRGAVCDEEGRPTANVADDAIDLLVISIRAAVSMYDDANALADNARRNRLLFTKERE